MSTIEQVREFHQTFGHPISDVPTEATPALRKLRLDLILEELKELAEASGFELISVFNDQTEDMEMVFIATQAEVDLVEVADALGDLDYVVAGAALVFGLPHDAVVTEIHRSNMSKLGADGKPIYREDMKVLKGPNYFKPDIAKVIAVNTR